MEYISAKTIVTNSKNSANWFGMDYNMNLYRGCCHGCIYCDSRSNCYHIDNFDTVKAKDKALEIIYEDLRRKAKKGVVMTGAMSDPYNPFEERLELTRNALNLINLFQFGAGIATKSPLITRDIDILQKIKSHSPTIVKITITTTDDELAKKIEPNTASSSERFAAIKQLSDNDIYCGILMMPILPFINDTEDNIVKLIHKAKENGAKFIYPNIGVTLRDNQREYFFEKIDEIFPKMSELYKKRFGIKYICYPPKIKELYSIFTEECEKLNISYNMKDIIYGYKKNYISEQLSLF